MVKINPEGTHTYTNVLLYFTINQSIAVRENRSNIVTYAFRTDSRLPDAHQPRILLLIRRRYITNRETAVEIKL